MSNELFSAEVLIALGILAVPTACITYFIYAIAKVKPAARPIAHFPHGVEGWLLVFVATMALSIILTAFSAMNTLSAMNTQGHIYWAAISPAIVTIGLYCYCLWLIARKREAFVVKHTIVILWVVGPISVLLLSLVFGVAVETYAVLRSSVYAFLRRGSIKDGPSAKRAKSQRRRYKEITNPKSLRFVNSGILVK